MDKYANVRISLENSLFVIIISIGVLKSKSEPFVKSIQCKKKIKNKKKKKQI